mgnify:CR=1 FL=1
MQTLILTPNQFFASYFRVIGSQLDDLGNYKLRLAQQTELVFQEFKVDPKYKPPILEKEVKDELVRLRANIDKEDKEKMADIRSLESICKFDTVRINRALYSLKEFRPRLARQLDQIIEQIDHNQPENCWYESLRTFVQKTHGCPSVLSRIHTFGLGRHTEVNNQYMVSINRCPHEYIFDPLNLFFFFQKTYPGSPLVKSLETRDPAIRNWNNNLATVSGETLNFILRKKLNKMIILYLKNKNFWRVLWLLRKQQRKLLRK